jgi:hypothetical protein
MIISEENKKFLCDESDEFRKLIEADDLDGLFILLNEVTVEHMDEEYYPTPYGRKAQEVYDDIYYDNCVANAQK